MLPNTRTRRSLRRPVALVLTGVVLALSLAGASPAVAAGAPGTDGISGAPATAQGADATRSRFDYQAAPGQTLTDYYIVRNTGTTSQKMNVFATDAYNTQDGGYGLLNTNITPSDAGSWVSFAGKSRHVIIPLAPKKTQIVPFTITVPADAAPGDHAAGIVISVTSPEGQILVDRRVATRVYVRVPGDLQPLLSISSIATSYKAKANPFDGTSTVTMTLRNDGNVALGANMVIGVKTYFGIGTGATQRVPLAEMLPRSTRTVSVDVTGVGQWGYIDPYVRLVPTIDPGALNPGPLREIVRDVPGFLMPWWALIILAIAGAVVLVIRLRRRRDAKNAREWIAFTEEEARRAAAEGQASAPVPETVGATSGRSSDGA